MTAAIVLKPGVRVSGLRPEAVMGALVAAGVYGRAGLREMVITSGLEGLHRVGSAHYRGDAVDLRTKGLPVPAQQLAEGIRAALSDEYDVLLEAQGSANEHIHLEHDPKGRR